MAKAAVPDIQVQRWPEQTSGVLGVPGGARTDDCNI